MYANPLLTFDEYRQQELRWYWYSLPDSVTHAEREEFSADVEEKIRGAWEKRRASLHPLQRRMSEMTWHHLHVQAQGDDF